MSALADVPGLAVVQEFPSPDAMREPLDDLAQLNGRMAEGMRALVEGLYEFVNAYAEAKFSTEALTQAVGAMVEAINDDGQINILTLAELIPPVADAVDEATGFGEHGKSVNAEGDVQAFTGH